MRMLVVGLIARVRLELCPGSVFLHGVAKEQALVTRLVHRRCKVQLAGESRSPASEKEKSVLGLELMALAARSQKSAHGFSPSDHDRFVSLHEGRRVKLAGVTGCPCWYLGGILRHVHIHARWYKHAEPQKHVQSCEPELQIPPSSHLAGLSRLLSVR